MQFRRRIEDKICDLLRQALATPHPAPLILAELQVVVHEYRALKASGRHLCGQRSDDMTTALDASDTDAQQTR